MFASNFAASETAILAKTALVAATCNEAESLPVSAFAICKYFLLAPAFSLLIGYRR
jgi:hypothetical protein